VGGAPSLPGGGDPDAGGVLPFGPLSEATEPNALIYLAYIGGVVLAVGLLCWGSASSKASDTERGVGDMDLDTDPGEVGQP
jgi:hypothetical protein